MTAASTPLPQRPAWKALEAHAQQVRGLHLRRLFADDPKRGERLTAEAAGIYLDYSKNRVTDETLRLLVRLAEECRLRERIDAMFRGDKINVTEGRAVLHVALRAPRGQVILEDGKDVVPQVHHVLDKMSGFADRVRGGEWLGYTGRPIRNRPGANNPLSASVNADFTPARIASASIPGVTRMARSSSTGIGVASVTVTGRFGSPAARSTDRADATAPASSPT